MDGTLKKHDWALRVEDYGPVGTEDCWYCKGCDADGGFSSYTPDDKPRPPTHGYRTQTQGPLELPEDCDLSKAMIEAYDFGNKAGREQGKSDSHTKNCYRPLADRFKYLFTGWLKPL